MSTSDVKVTSLGLFILDTFEYNDENGQPVSRPLPLARTAGIPLDRFELTLTPTCPCPRSFELKVRLLLEEGEPTPSLGRGCGCLRSSLGSWSTGATTGQPR